MNNETNWLDHLSLDNLVPHTDSSAGWCDRHSSLSLSWIMPEERGIQALVAMLGWGGTVLTRQLLNWHVSEGETQLPLRLVSRNFRPDYVHEVDAAAQLSIHAYLACPLRNTFAVRLELHNEAPTERTLRLEFDYPGKDIAPDWQGIYPVIDTGFMNGNNVAGHCVRIEEEPLGCWSTLFLHQEHGTNAFWVSQYVAGMPKAQLEMVCLSDLCERKLTIPAGGQASLTLSFAFGYNRGKARALDTQLQQRLQQGWTPLMESERHHALLASAPPLPAKYAADATSARMYAHAISGLNSLFIQGDGGYCGDKRIPWTTKHQLAIAFFWDTSFSCIGGREFNALACQEAIECFTDNVTPRGSMPGTLCDTHHAGDGQAPIMCWAAWLVFQRSADREWLARVYPILAGYINFWFRDHSSPDGFAQWYNAGQIGDNDPRFDPVYGRSIANESVTGMTSPDLNAYHMMEMRCLGHIAQELGLDDEASQWRARAEALGTAIVDSMYFPEEAMFYDVREGTREKFSGTKNPYMFIPLWAGVPLPEAEVRRVIERHMLNPDEFYRDLPFPSVSYDHPGYDPTGYWRGRIWPHVVYWMVQALWRYGYHAEAELTVQRLLDLYQTTPWFQENYPSDRTKWVDGAAGSFPDYNWAHATVIELLLERYKDPMP